MVLIRSLLLILVFVNFALADLRKEIAECTSIEDDGRRLECYDSIADKLRDDSSLAKPAIGPGKWSVATERSKIDDSTNVYLSLESEDTINTGYEIIRPVLHLRCAEDKTTLFIVWYLYLGANSIEVLTRFDEQKAVSRYWNISTDNRAIFAPGRDTKYAKRLMKHEKLLVQLTPSGRSPVMATFDITGLAEAIQPLQKACHWQ